MEEFAIGERVANRYRVERELGRGGMGVVYVARDGVLDRNVAIKGISAAGYERTQRSSDDPIRQFENEALATAKLNNPHVVTVFDAGIHRRIPFLVMELLEGEDLETLMARNGGEPLSPERAVSLMLEVSFAIAGAHQYQIFHRDLSATNVFVTKFLTKVLDFGLARLQDRPRETERGYVRGTWQYTPPERFQGQDLHAASDIYSIGVLLYETLTGGVPFMNETQKKPLVGDMLVPAIVAGFYSRPRQRNPKLAADLEEVVLHAMALRPADRFPSVHELGRALLPFAPRVGRMITDHFEGPEPMVQRIEVLTGPHPGAVVADVSSDPIRSMAARVMPFAMSRHGEGLDPAAELGDALLMQEKLTAPAKYQDRTLAAQISEASGISPVHESVEMATGETTRNVSGFKGTTSDVWMRGDSEGRVHELSTGRRGFVIGIVFLGAAAAAAAFFMKRTQPPSVENVVDTSLVHEGPATSQVTVVVDAGDAVPPVEAVVPLSAVEPAHELSAPERPTSTRPPRTSKKQPRRSIPANKPSGVRFIDGVPDFDK